MGKKYDGKQVRSEVHQVFCMLAEAYGIKISEKDLPDVYVEPVANSKYLSNNTIIISFEDVGYGPVYFEEASHALRELKTWRTIPGLITHLVSSLDPSVHEFYGRAGETLGRELVKGTELEYLFKDAPERDILSKDARKKQADSLRKFRKIEQGSKKIGISESEALVELASSRAHLKPYEFAQQYDAKTLLGIKNFYGLSDRTVKRRFFKRLKPLSSYGRNSTSPLLEQRVTASLITALALSFVLLINNLKSTGFAIALSPQNNFSLVLWVIFIILAGVLGYIKLRKFIRKK